MTLLVMNIIKSPPHIQLHIHTYAHTCDQMPLYLYLECNLKLLHPCISLSLCCLLFLCSAFLLPLLYVRHFPLRGASEWPYHLLAFSFASPLNLGFLWTLAITHRLTLSHTDALTDVIIHPIYDTSALIEFQLSNLSWETHTQSNGETRCLYRIILLWTN